MQVNYTPDLLSAEARMLHQSFAKHHPDVSTYLPLCLPPSPLGELSRWATPDDCDGCIFREGDRCGGLGRSLGELLDEETISPPSELTMVADAGGALCADWDTSILTSLDTPRDLMSADPPLCYWWPQAVHLQSITDALTRCRVSSLWDLGGGNGYLAWLIHQASQRRGETLDEVLWIDPVASIYPDREGVKKWPHTAEHALVEGRAALVL